MVWGLGLGGSASGGGQGPEAPWPRDRGWESGRGAEVTVGLSAPACEFGLGLAAEPRTQPGRGCLRLLVRVSEPDKNIS